ncbi:MAG TPA: glycosyltransferase 87 family protein [Ktedonosporobacter sp.]|nr:glycosyltransferase 87 family protein [Ktedonosporobacter sp.]
MSLVKIASVVQGDGAVEEGGMHWRLPALALLLICSLGIEVGFLVNHFHPDGPLFPFMFFFLAGFVPYLAACAIVLKTRRATGRWRWLELGLLLVGAVLLRAMLLQVDPFLSPDSWRYLWDARITLHGYSPYIYAPQNPILTHLREANYYKMAFHHVPTIYPPGAQLVYLISYLIAPENLVMLKTIFLLFDIVTCAALAYWLTRRGLDPARAIIYAWCPLPIIDFAIQGHLDVLAITFSLLAVISSLNESKRGRVLTGFLIGMATLAKIYPILLLVVIVRRRSSQHRDDGQLRGDAGHRLYAQGMGLLREVGYDWPLVLTCVATIVLGYLPYIVLGHGQVLGFFSTYADEHGPNSGLVQQIMTQVYRHTGYYNVVIEHIMEAFVLGGVSLWMLILRWKERISLEAAMLILLGTLFAVSSHIFPWYTTALLPWIAVTVQPVWKRGKGLNPAGLAVAMAWYFSSAILLHYFFDRLPDWTVYYVVVYDVVLLGVAVAIGVSVYRMRIERK